MCATGSLRRLAPAPVARTASVSPPWLAAYCYASPIFAFLGDVLLNGLRSSPNNPKNIDSARGRFRS